MTSIRRITKAYTIQIPQTASGHDALNLIIQQYVLPLQAAIAKEQPFFEIRTTYAGQHSPQLTRCVLCEHYTCADGKYTKQSTLMNSDNTQNTSMNGLESVNLSVISEESRVSAFMNMFNLQIVDQKLLKGIVFQKDNKYVKIFQEINPMCVMSEPYANCAEDFVLMEQLMTFTNPDTNEQITTDSVQIEIQIYEKSGYDLVTEALKLASCISLRVE